MIPENQGINLSEHTDLFVKAKGTDKYVCPICNGNDLAIHKTSGKYNCYSSDGDCNKEIFKWTCHQLGITQDKKEFFSTQTKRGISFYSSSLVTEKIEATYQDLIAYQSGKKDHVKFLYKNLNGENCYVIRKDFGDVKIKSKPYTHKENKLQVGKFNTAWLGFQSDLYHLCERNYINLTEGEKDAVICQKRSGILTTCLANGGSDYEQKLLFLELQKNNIKGGIYWYDNDKTGENKANKLKSIADKLEFDLTIIPITYLYPNCPDKGDLTDFFLDADISDYLKTKDHLESVANKYKNEQCNTVTPNIDKSLEKNISDKEFRKISALNKVRKLNPKTIDPRFTDDFFLIPEILPKGNLIQIIALPKVGKSLLAYDLIGSLINEEEFLGYTINQENKNVLVIQCDETQAESDPRLAIRLGKYDDRVNVVNDFNLDEENIKDFEIWVKEIKPSLILIDSLKSINNGAYNENDSTIAEPLAKMKRIAMQNESTIILIHHATKNKENQNTAKSRGSTAIPALCHSTWILDKANDINGLERIKLNITGRCSPKKFLLEFDDEFNHFNVVTDDPEVQNTLIEDDLPVSKKLEQLIPELINKGITTKKDLLEKTSANNRTFERVIRTLISSGKIERGGEHRKPYYSILSTQTSTQRSTQRSTQLSTQLSTQTSTQDQLISESTDISLIASTQRSTQTDRGVCEENSDQDSLREKEYYVCPTNLNDVNNNNIIQENLFTTQENLSSNFDFKEIGSGLCRMGYPDKESRLGFVRNLFGDQTIQSILDLNNLQLSQLVEIIKTSS